MDKEKDFTPQTEYIRKQDAFDAFEARIAELMTHPEFRRKHYAENLVYQVTKHVRDAGYIPMLYTDADYTASNSCYEKIGYVLRGKLCTIA